MSLTSEASISVIIPVYNSQEYVARAIESVIEQDIQNLQIIIIDDGSTDRSGEIVDEYAKRNDYIEVVHTKNQGVSHARNVGLKRAVGKWIYFMDSDDELVINAFRCIVQNEANNHDMVVFSAIFKYLQKGIECIKAAEAKELIGQQNIKDYMANMSQETKDVFLNYLWNRLFLHSIIEENNLLFDESLNLGEDFAFICSYLQYCHSVLVLPEAYYIYYIRGTASLVGRFDRNEYMRRIRMRETFKSLLITFEINPDECAVFVTNEGLNLISSMNKVFSPRCSLETKKEKIEYLEDFINEENLKYVSAYLEKRHSKTNSLLKMIFKSKNCDFIYCFMGALYKLKNRISN